MSLLRTRIDVGAIAHNTRLLKDRLGGCRLMAVVKADAYNHGVQRVAPVMAANGADAFGVATLPEALKLEKVVDLPVLAWMWEPSSEFLADALAAGIHLGVPSARHARTLIDADVPGSIAIMVDTGMHRSGIDRGEWDEVFTALRDAAHLTVTGIFSHFACADEPEHEANDAQQAVFEEAIARGRELGLELPVNHIANSAAALTRPASFHEQARVGLALYGLSPVAGDVGLRPAMTWAADVLTVKPVRAGESVSYGWTWTAQADGWLALVPCGYADGLPRRAQGMGVGIGGRLYEQVGRVCMDQLVVDLGDNPFGVAAGDEAVLFGAGGQSADELASAVGTINYEVVCLPGGRTVRTYEE